MSCLTNQLISVFLGNSTRIDYGTGHEMNFALFLMCLFKLEYFTEADAPVVVARVFDRLLLALYIKQAYLCEVYHLIRCILICVSLTKHK